MTLTKVKPRRPTTDHKKRVGQHHHHSNDYVKTYWPYLPVITILVAGLLVNGLFGRVDKNVLGYATDMSVGSLLSDTNSQRADNSEGALNLNAQLNQAAQAKANDMAARNYWSHNTPDGQTPWTFITAAGYGYQTAGENLAYGFATANDTLIGWMNSPEHRANILNTTYVDVGFGIANIADYQNNGPETLVVAMYGSLPGETAPVAVATPSQPAASHSAPASANKPASTPAQDASEPAPNSAQTPIATSRPANQVASSKPTVVKDTIEPAPQRVTQLQLVASNTPLNTLVVTIFAFSACGLLIVRHSWAWRKVLVKGERLVLHHPFLDISAITIVSAAIALSHTAGLIR